MFFGLRGVLGVPFADDGGERLELLLLDEVKLLNEEDKVASASVDVRGEVLLLDVMSMRQVEMGIDAEEAAEDVFHRRTECLGEGHVGLLWEQCRILQLLLHPAHQIVNIFWSTARDGLLHLHSIRPLVLVLGTCIHNRARLRRAQFSKVLIQNLNLVEEIQHCTDNRSRGET